MTDPDTQSERCFVDTNVWLYALLEGDDPQKTARAKALLETAKAVVVSSQVVNEVCVTMLKKAKFAEESLRLLIEAFYAKYLVVQVSKEVLLKASALREQYAFSYWDSTVVASALHAEASTLYSEDMQDGMVIDHRVRIINPVK